MLTANRVLAGVLVTALAATTMPAAASTAVPASAGSPTTWGLAGQWQVGQYGVDAVEVTATRVVTVSDTDNRVQIWSPDGTLVSQFSIGSDVAATGIAVAPDGMIFVGDYSNETGVHVYRPDGAPYATFAPPGVESFSPWGIDVDRSGNAYVADPVADTVYRFDAGSGAVTTIGRPGAARGQLDNPYDVAVAPDGTVLVADGNNHRVQRFTAGGAFVSAFGSAGWSPGQFRSPPHSIDVMPDGTIAVGAASQPVRIYTASGGFVQEVRAGSEVTALATGPDRRIYVAALLDRPVAWGVAALAPRRPGIARVTAPKRGVRVVRKKVALTIRCVSTTPSTPCRGRVELRVKGRTISKPRTYAIATGGRAKVKVALTKRGLAIVRKRPVTKAVATVTGSRTTIRIRR